MATNQKSKAELLVRSEPTVVTPPESEVEAISRFREMLANWVRKGMDEKMGAKVLRAIDSIAQKVIVAIVVLLGTEAEAHDLPELIQEVDVDRIEINHAYSVEGQHTEKVFDQTIFWNWRQGVVDGQEGEFIADKYVMGEKTLTFRAGYYHVFAFDKGQMYKVRSRYLIETWSRNDYGHGGDPERINKVKFPDVKRRGIFPRKK